jgi:3',5'-cyclic-AMP phosphodiesterase
MRPTTRRLAMIGVLAATTTCVQPADERSAGELEIGRASADGCAIEVDGGLAHVRGLTAGAVSLWAQAPAIAFELEVAAAAAGRFTIAVDNALPDAVLGGAARHGGDAGERPTRRVFVVDLPAGRHRLTVAPPDAATIERFHFAAMADIQTAMGSVDEVFARIAAEPQVRFVISMGDIAQEARPEEYDAFEAKLAALPVPYYTTIGNHDLWESVSPFRERFGRANLHFDFKGVAFSLVDSGSAGLDPLVYDWLAGWLDQARDRPHVFGTHFPPIDPVGIRSGGFRSRAEAEKLLALLARGQVDLTLYGHIHSYLAYDNAGIPAHISGGGGARPEKLDGIGRHFLVIEAVPEENRIGGVAVVRVD